MKAKLIASILLSAATLANAQLSLLPGDNAISLAAGEQTEPAIVRAVLSGANGGVGFGLVEV